MKFRTWPLLILLVLGLSLWGPAVWIQVLICLPIGFLSGAIDERLRRRESV